MDAIVPKLKLVDPESARTSVGGIEVPTLSDAELAIACDLFFGPSATKFDSPQRAAAFARMSLVLGAHLHSRISSCFASPNPAHQQALKSLAPHLAGWAAAVENLDAEWTCDFAALVPRILANPGAGNHGAATFHLRCAPDVLGPLPGTLRQGKLEPLRVDLPRMEAASPPAWCGLAAPVPTFASALKGSQLRQMLRNYFANPRALDAADRFARAGASANIAATQAFKLAAASRWLHGSVVQELAEEVDDGLKNGACLFFDRAMLVVVHEEFPTAVIFFVDSANIVRSAAELHVRVFPKGGVFAVDIEPVGPGAFRTLVQAGVLHDGSEVLAGLRRAQVPGRKSAKTTSPN